MWECKSVNNLNLSMLKRCILLIVAVSVSIAANAQSGYNYNNFGFGFGVSGLRPQADLKKQYNDLGYHANFTYYYNPYVPIEIELQLGKLRGGGDNVADDKDTRKFLNTYKALMIHIDYQLGDAIDYQRNGFLNIIKNFYGGIGFGAILNSVAVNRNSLLVPSYVFPGNNKSVNLIVPIRFGYEFKIYDYYGIPKFGINLGYVHNVTFGEGLDGYDDPNAKFKNNAPDQYRQVVIGLKYNFGYESGYDKTIKGN